MTDLVELLKRTRELVNPTLVVSHWNNMPEADRARVLTGLGFGSQARDLAGSSFDDLPPNVRMALQLHAEVR